MFKALVSRRDEDGKVVSAVETVDEAALPDGDVTVDVAWAGFNYKDGLCITGQGGLVRDYPHVAGIDFAGTVSASDNARFAVGAPVILTGWRVGEARWGGFAQKARVKGAWLVPLPKGLVARDAMVLGTAGLTAMLAIDRLEKGGLTPQAGPVLVTGAGGGVGSQAVLLLARLGYTVAAVTGRAALGDDLKRLGAAEILSRDDFAEPEKPRALESEKWAGVVDTVAGPNFGRILKQVRHGGGVAAVGLAGGAAWQGSIVPFILRGVELYGIDSVTQPFAARVAAWERLSGLFAPDDYAGMVGEARLADLPELGPRILAGGVRGRYVVNPNA